ncbi:MAG: tetratricopeptide repeat protein [Caldilineaceae bacterium]
MNSPKRKPIIFLAFASVLTPGYIELPGLAHEARALRKTLEHRGCYEVVVRENATLDDILDVFGKEEYHGHIAVFHYGGHAESDFLLLQSDGGKLLPAYANGFAAFLAEQPGLRLVFLNACSTAAQVEELLGAGVGAVVATEKEIPDDLAHRFAARFYTGLAGGATIESAFRAAEAAAQAAHGDREEWPWRVYSRSAANLAWALPPDGRGGMGGARLWVNVPSLANRGNIVGRQELLDELVQRLRGRHSPALSADGLPGVGKTTLAILIANDERVRDYFTGGVLWAGLGPIPDIASIQAAWAEALGIDLREVPDPQQWQARISAALGDRRVLVVIDDAWQVEAAEALRCSAPGAAHLLTTRNGSLAREFAGASQSLKVPVLDDDTALGLLQKLAPEACMADLEAARRLAYTVGGLPLAVELLGGYLAAPERIVFSDLSQAALGELDDPARRLALAQKRLGSTTGKKETLAAVVQLSVDDLAQQCPEALHAFHALGAFAPKPATFTRAAAVEVTGVSAGTLALLAARNLLEVDDSGTLAVHQVLHDVAATHVPAEAVIRHRSYYLGMVNRDQQDWQAIALVYAQVKHAWTALPPDDTDGALALALELKQFQGVQGFHPDKIAWSENALALAISDDRPGDAASMLLSLGDSWSALGDKRQALAYLEQALPLARQVRDKRGEATALNNIGVVYSDLSDKQRALVYFEQALLLRRQVEDKGGEAATLNNIGAVYSARGDKQSALEYFEQALQLRRKAGDMRGEATTLANIGRVYTDLGATQGVLTYFEQALAHFEQALPIYRQVGDKSGEAVIFNHIGGVYSALGNKQKALTYYEQALPLRRQVGDKGGEATSLNNIGRVYSALGDQQQALAHFERALPLRRQVEDKGGEAITLTNIGGAYSALGNKQQALAYFEQALPLFSQLGDKRGEATTLNNIGRVYSDLHDKRRAMAYFEQALPLQRQMEDRWGEVVTRNNIAMAAAALADLARAEEELQIVVSIDETTGHPDLESERAALRYIRFLRRQQGR